MKKSKNTFRLITSIILMISILISIGCAMRATAMNRIELGMTKKQIISILGTPASTGAPGKGVEILQYRFAADSMASAYWVYSNYFVLLRNGVVEEYGKVGQATNPALDINVKTK